MSRYRFSKNQCDKINEIYGKDIDVKKMEADRPRYLHFLYEYKNDLKILREYNKYIDNIVNKTMKFKNCGLSRAKDVLNMRTDFMIRNDELRCEERKIDHYDFIAAEGMVPIMTRTDKSKITRMNITRFIGQKYIKLKSENSPIIQEYENKKCNIIKKINDIMKVVKVKMGSKSFNEIFPLWSTM